MSVRTATLYSFGCKKTKNLGADEILRKFILSKKTEEGDVLEILKKLQPYPAYLKLVSVVGKENLFCKEVVNAYWLGGRRLNKFERLLPFHNFETLSLAAAAKKDEKTLKEILPEAVDCCVLSGIVKRIFKNQRADVEYRPIEYWGGKFRFGSSHRKEIKTDFLKNVKVGDLVSFHLGYAREKISVRENDELLIWTQKTLNILNEK